MRARDKLPPRTLPVIYLAFAHLALLAGFALLLVDPQAVMKFFFDPRTLTVVHCITLGWITATAIGATYIVGPIALRMPTRTTWVDTLACVLYLLGAIGIPVHFWMLDPIEPRYWGLATAGAFVLPAVGIVTVRTLRALAHGAAPLPVRLHVGAAYLNLSLAALLGILLAINRQYLFLPSTHLRSVFAHAHLAGVGWATLLVAGVGYRLLSMYFPAKPPGDRPVWASLILFEVPVLGLVLSLIFKPAWAPWFATALAGAIVCFLAIVAVMRRNPRPPPMKARRPDFGILHVLQALVYLGVATAAGLIVVWSDDLPLAAVWVYGVCGLIGFLCQFIIGVQMRLLPMFAFTEAWAGSDYKVLPKSPHEMPRRVLQIASFVCWSAGIPLLAGGLARANEGAVTAGAACLLVGLVVATANNILVVRHAFFLPSK